MPSVVQIRTGARLHFGPLTNGVREGRLFGGIGLMVDSPRLCVTVSLAERDACDAPAAMIPRIERIRDRSREACGLASPLSIAIPQGGGLHSGLGTGTQLGIAIAKGIALLSNRSGVSLAELSDWAERGARSALGVHGFARGGFLVDGGKRSEDALGTLAARHDVPHPWRFVLVTPPDAEGLSGSAEAETFHRLAPMPAETTNRLCRLVLLDILPAIAEGDLDRFGDSLYEYGAAVGDYFAEVQGGRYAHPRMRSLVDWLRAAGIRGVGQTSWGPTIFAVCRDAMQADELRREMAASGAWSDCRVMAAGPMNAGAAIDPPQ
jgi:beta-RFAP synthase